MRTSGLIRINQPTVCVRCREVIARGDRAAVDGPGMLACVACLEEADRG